MDTGDLSTDLTAEVLAPTSAIRAADGALLLAGCRRQRTPPCAEAEKENFETPTSRRRAAPGSSAGRLGLTHETPLPCTMLSTIRLDPALRDLGYRDSQPARLALLDGTRREPAVVANVALLAGRSLAAGGAGEQLRLDERSPLAALEPIPAPATPLSVPNPQLRHPSAASRASPGALLARAQQLAANARQPVGRDGEELRSVR